MVDRRGLRGLPAGYFGGTSASCTGIGTTLLTIVVGPLNYVGVNPKIDCTVPQRSS
ncbi:hypothetical protein ACFQV8_17840 [Pseudonocardia benzenivorans]